MGKEIKSLFKIALCSETGRRDELMPICHAGIKLKNKGKYSLTNTIRNLEEHNLPKKKKIVKELLEHNC